MNARIGKLRAQEAAYRRQCASGYSQVATRRTYPPRLVSWFWRIVTGVVIVTALDVAGSANYAEHAVERLWRNW